jgi:hypothetical protein
MKEQWTDIEGYDGLYQVSSQGNVKSLERTFLFGKDYQIEQRHPERLLTIRTYKKGYKYVGLSKNGEVRKFKVHRLVAQAFIPNPNNLPCIDHKNGVRGDNRVENLHWVDAFENMNNPHTLKASRESKLGARNPMKMKQRPVLMIDRTSKQVVGEYEGCKAAARELGLDSSVISRCCRSANRTYRGFIFRYK